MQLKVEIMVQLKSRFLVSTTRIHCMLLCELHTAKKDRGGMREAVVDNGKALLRAKSD